MSVVKEDTNENNSQPDLTKTSLTSASLENEVQEQAITEQSAVQNGVSPDVPIVTDVPIIQDSAVNSISNNAVVDDDSIAAAVAAAAAAIVGGLDVMDPNALGPDLAQSITKGVQPTPEALQAVLPAVMAAALKLMPVAIMIGWMIFLAVPRVVLDKRQGFVALLDAVRAIYSNLGAFILFSAALLLAAVVLSVMMAIPFALLNATGALAGVLRTFILIFVSTFAFSFYLNAMYIAWRDIFMTETTGTASRPGQQKEQEAQIEV